MYRRMSVANATRFRQSNKGYSIYLCNISKANLFRHDGDDQTPCKECTYLVNEQKRTISLSELMRGKYDVIFVSSDADDAGGGKQPMGRAVGGMQGTNKGLAEG